MTPAEVAAILQHFNDWRRGHHDDTAMPDPREIGKAIDAAVEMIERVVRLEPQPSPSTRDHNWYYAEGWNDCLREMTREESK